MKLDLIEHIEVSRSYSKRVQEAQYEPVEYFSSYTAIVKPGATEEEIKLISEDLAERVEDEVMEKINPSKTISRRVTLAELKTQLSTQAKEIGKLKEELSKVSPF